MHEPCLEKYVHGVPHSTHHPVTLVNFCFSLYDPFHEGNTSQKREYLRRTRFIKELDGSINRETAEQMNRRVSKNLYFLNEMSPKHHLQFMRSILACHNIMKNNEFDQNLKKRFGDMFSFTFDPLGRRLVIPTNSPQQLSSFKKNAQVQRNIKVDDIIPSSFFFTNVTPEFMSSFNLEDCFGSHSVLKDDSPINLSKEDLSSLLPDNNVDGNILDLLLLVFGAVASRNGINVCILPSHFLASLCWDSSQETLIPNSLEKYHCLFALSRRTDHWCLTGFDRRSKKIFYLDPLGSDYRQTENAAQHITIMTLIVMERVIGANKVESLEDHQWSVVTITEFSGIFGFDLPLQYLSKDCGIFCVLYAFYLMFHKQFDFCQNDMTTIRFKLLKIIKECAVSPIVLEYIKDITCDSWALLAKERLRGSNIGMLPKEMLVKFFEEACENKYDISCQKKMFVNIG